MFKRVIVSLAAFWICSSCGKPPADAFCTYEPLPQTTDAAAGQGAIQILAPTDEYFYVFDEAGKQISYGSMNRALALKPGKYQVKVNKSPHSVTVQAKTLTKCSAGTLLVSGSTDEYYYVFDGSKTQLAYHKLGSPLAFFPGDYSVTVNKTSATASLKSAATTTLKAGVLNVQGSTDEYYYVFDGAGTQLAYNKLSKPLSFFAGPLTVKVNATSGPVNIAPAAVTEARTGALVVQGTTDEYYYVFDSLGNQLAYNKLSQPLSFLPGSYSVKVNKSPIAVTVEAGRSNEYPTASLTLKASGDEYYYVLDTNGTQLGYNKVNQPLSFPAGKYSVKLGKETRPVTLAAGQPMILNW
jgi:uncharacterized membrane protein